MHALVLPPNSKLHPRVIHTLHHHGEHHPVVFTTCSGSTVPVELHCFHYCFPFGCSFGYNMGKRSMTRIGRKHKRHAAGAAIAYSNNPAGRAGQQNLFLNPLPPPVAQERSNTPPNHHGRSPHNLTISTSRGSSQNHIRFDITQDHDNDPPYANTTTSPPRTTVPCPDKPSPITITPLSQIVKNNYPHQQKALHHIFSHTPLQDNPLPPPPIIPVKTYSQQELIPPD